jgi:hypothetical protein
MLGKKSRIFVLVGMVALLVVTGALNIILTKTRKMRKQMRTCNLVVAISS